MMMPNLNQIMNIISQLKQNPMALLSPRFNIPQDMTDPNKIIQHLLNTGQVTQDQVNYAMQMRNNPFFKNIK